MISGTISKAVENMWPMLVIFMVVLITIRIAYLKTNKKEFIFYKEVLSLIFIIYLLLLFEFVTNSDGGNSGVNLVPFTEIFRYSLTSELFLFNVVGNILVFLPFGYFASAYIKSKSVGQMALITFITSLTIELIQYRTGRIFDIDDIILNVLGGILGFLLYVGLKAVKKHLPEIFQRDFIYNIIMIILITLGILYYFGIYNFGW